MNPLGRILDLCSSQDFIAEMAAEVLGSPQIDASIVEHCGQRRFHCSQLDETGLPTRLERDQ